ncbi:cell envelope integrity protein CreD [Caenimonas sedimenti]|uniref:Cell envelope integrity protein CreD n=1 Tax=Caenimonas sedimenti TaxID=2596921 RepID=A0A562ZQJ0_9BURK|nr:cell envelope integrity protein CreD [Caenimonas sedimenti]TWO70616.1 cell envelope integrity protein CreD [Caenimonas sedimenti]
MKLFSNSVLLKVLLLAALTLLAVLPLSQISGLIHERGASRDQAKQALAAAHAGPQTLAGPVIVVPYVERWVEEKRGDDGKLKATVPHSRELAHIIFPERFDLRGEMNAQQRYRGIFTVQFYDLKAGVTGRFPAFDPATIKPSTAAATLEIGAPLLAMSLSDIRGLQGAPALTLAGESARWLPRIPGLPAGSLLAQGIHVPLAGAALTAWQQRRAIDWRMQIALVGQERLSILPLADETTAHLKSNWPHPSFGGEFLATRRTVTDTGFEADWAVSSLSSAARMQLLRGGEAGRPGDLSALDTFDVSLVEPLNVYAMATRAVKYGLLFVALTLMAAFMFELFRDLRLHPVQYGLVGLSITLFFLLLLALSEKVDFLIAYAVAAGASVLLLTVYFSAVLRGWRRGLGLGGYVTVLYAALYGLLSSEDNALLLGALLLFGLLGLLMVATRRVDWYALSGPREPAPEPASA